MAIVGVWRVTTGRLTRHADGTPQRTLPGKFPSRRVGPKIILINRRDGVGRRPCGSREVICHLRPSPVCRMICLSLTSRDARPPPRARLTRNREPLPLPRPTRRVSSTPAFPAVKTAPATPYVSDYFSITGKCFRLDDDDCLLFFRHTTTTRPSVRCQFLAGPTTLLAFVLPETVRRK